jgi:hypothetical protein
MQTLKLCPLRSRDSAVGIAIGYGLDDRGVGVRLPVVGSRITLLHVVQTGSGVHPASYPMSTRGSFPRVKRAGREAGHSPHLICETIRAFFNNRWVSPKGRRDDGQSNF